MSKSGQKATSNEGSPMAKSIPATPAKARHINLVMCSPRSEENSSQSMGYPVNLGNADERKEVEISIQETGATRLKFRSRIFSSEPTRECSTTGNWCGRIDQLHTDSDERKYSSSNSTRKLAVSSPELRNMEYTNHQYMSKIFQFLQKKLGMSASDATFSIQTYKTHVLILAMFMTSSMKAANHLGRIIFRIRKSTRTQNSRRLGVRSTLLKSW